MCDDYQDDETIAAMMQRVTCPECLSLIEKLEGEMAIKETEKPFDVTIPDSVTLCALLHMLRPGSMIKEQEGQRTYYVPNYEWFSKHTALNINGYVIDKSDNTLMKVTDLDYYPVRVSPPPTGVTPTGRLFELNP